MSELQIMTHNAPNNDDTQQPTYNNYGQVIPSGIDDGMINIIHAALSNPDENNT